MRRTAVLLALVVGLSYLLQWSLKGSHLEWMALVFLAVTLVGLAVFLKTPVKETS